MNCSKCGTPLNEHEISEEEAKQRAEVLMEILTNGGLFSAECAEDQSHGCVVIWSSGAQEQIEAALS